MVKIRYLIDLTVICRVVGRGVLKQITFLSTGQCHLVNAGNLLDIYDCEVST